MSDLHCGENVDQDLNTTEVIRTLVHAENPDFLAFSGDMVSGRGLKREVIIYRICMGSESKLVRTYLEAMDSSSYGVEETLWIHSW